MATTVHRAALSSLKYRAVRPAQSKGRKVSIYFLYASLLLYIGLGNWFISTAGIGGIGKQSPYILDVL